jgi:hypothetical protein
MGGQTELSPVRLGSLFDSVVKKADEGMIGGKSGVGCGVASRPRKKKLLLRKRRLQSSEE